MDYSNENMKKLIKEMLVNVLKEDYPDVPNIENLIEVKENKDLTKGEYCVSLHKFANYLNKK